MARRVDQSGLQIGDTVRYVGNVVKNKIGKRAMIVGTKGEYGFYLRYEDGTPGSATPEALQLVRKGSLGVVDRNDEYNARSTPPPRSTEHFEPCPPVNPPSTQVRPAEDSMRSKVSFCSPEAIDCEGLFGLLMNRVIGLDRAEFAEVYQRFRGSFAHESGPPEDALVNDFIHKPLSLVNRDLLPGAGVERAGVKHPGIDLPCWIEGARSDEVAQSDRRIILLGQDSLRSDKFFPVPAADSAPCVSIGTPYGAHSRALWQYHNCPRYWEVIRRLLNEGYNFYLTDVFKFWYKGVAYDVTGKTYRSILEQEFDVIKASGPGSLVVAFGQRVADFVDPGRGVLARGGISETCAAIRNVDGRRMLRVLHPSPKNNGVLPDFLRANDVDPKQGVAGIGEVIVRAIVGGIRNNLLDPGFKPRWFASDRPNGKPQPEQQIKSQNSEGRDWPHAGYTADQSSTEEAMISFNTPPGRGVPNTFLQGLAEELRKLGFRRVDYRPPRNAIVFYDTTLPRAGNTRYGLTFQRSPIVRAELFIDTRDKDRNKRVFDALKKGELNVEKEFGESLSWERRDDGEGSRIALRRTGSLRDDDKTLQEIKTWAIERLLKFKQVFNPRLDQLGSL